MRCSIGTSSEIIPVLWWSSPGQCKGDGLTMLFCSNSVFFLFLKFPDDYLHVNKVQLKYLTMFVNRGSRFRVITGLLQGFEMLSHALVAKIVVC